MSGFWIIRDHEFRMQSAGFRSCCLFRIQDLGFGGWDLGMRSLVFRCWNLGIMTYQIRHDEVSGFGVREDLAEPEGVDSHRCHKIQEQAWFRVLGLGFGV